MNFIFKLKNNL